MRRVIASSMLASALVLAAALAPHAGALELGGPAGGFLVQPGSVATFSSLGFNACNSLTWGYQLNGGSNQGQHTFGGGCGTGSAPNVVVGPFATPTSLRVFLTDNHCSFTYYSDGTPVDHVIVAGTNPFTLRFADSGGFCEHTTTTLNTFAGCNFCATLTITDAAISAIGQNVTGVEGTNLSATVATFTDPDSAAAPADYAAVVSWGDGGSSAGTITGTSTFAISGSHTYVEEGTYTISVAITDGDTPSNSATTTSSASIADAPLAASPACSASALGSYSGKTATFSDAAGGAGTASDFAAGINWGDGTLSAGTITASGGGAYAVSGSHHYASTGLFTITTNVTDDGGSVAATSCTTIGFQFAPGGGAFVIGAGHSALGQSVTFWDAQWAKLNTSTAVRPAHNFKGFAATPASPTCGVEWSGDPGSSTPPPSGPLPEFMGVIVTGSVQQSGSNLSGTVVHLVVVKTNPGYSTNPGHSGTGTVVAVVC